MRVRPIALGLFLVVLFIIPVITKDPYYLHVFIAAGIQCILAVGFWMLLTAGNITVAQATFLGIGAYTSVVLVMKAGLPFWGAFPIAGIVAGLLGLLLGYPTLRLRGVYFVMVTLGFGMILGTFWGRWWWLFGFHTGVLNIPSPGSVSLFGLYTIQFSSHHRVSFYYLILIFALIMLFIMYRLTHSRIGLTFQAIRGSDELAKSVGIDLARYRVIAFSATCFFAGIAGSFYAHYMGFISNVDFGFGQSVHVLMAVMIGGSGAFTGPIVGVGFLSLLNELLRPLQEYIPLVHGAMLIVVMVFLPGGIYGTWQRASSRVWQRARRSFVKEKGDLVR